MFRAVRDSETFCRQEKTQTDRQSGKLIYVDYSNLGSHPEHAGSTGSRIWSAEIRSN